MSLTHCHILINLGAGTSLTKQFDDVLGRVPGEMSRELAVCRRTPGNGKRHLDDQISLKPPAWRS